jgi:hypothetical protein
VQSSADRCGVAQVAGFNIGVACKFAEVVVGEPLDFDCHGWHTGVVVKGFITDVPGCVECYAQCFGLYSLWDFSVCRLSTAPELYPVSPYGLQDGFI